MSKQRQLKAQIKKQLKIKFKKNKKLQNRTGGIFILVLFILVGLTVLGMSVITTSLYGLKMERQNYEREEDFAHTEAGIHRYQFFLNLNEDYYENLELLEGELNYEISQGRVNTGQEYPIGDNKNIFIKSMRKNTDGTFTYTPNYYPYENGYYKVEIDKTQTQSERNSGLLEGDRQQLTILTTYYEDKPGGTERIPVRIENTEQNKTVIVKRKIETRFARKQFTETAYLSDVEGSIWWATGETFNGAFHTNSDIHILGTPQFNGPVTYSGSVIARDAYGSSYEVSNPATTLSNVFLQGIVKVPIVQFPNTVEDIQIIVKPEHKYTGMVWIRFDKDHPDKYFIKRRTVKEHEYFTDYFMPEWRAEEGPIDIPSNGLIYVANETDPVLENHNGELRRSNYYIANDSDSRTLQQYYNLTAAYRQKKWGIPEDDIVGVAEGDLYTSGQQGNVFIEGELSGGVTIVAENNIYITGDLVYLDPQKDILGLIANYDVLVNHFAAKADFMSPRQEIETFENNEININAAIYAGRKFGFELYKDNSDYNRKGFINLNGALINKKRGYVGVIGQAGFDKNYTYDTRLQSMTPPHFIQPINAPWEIKYERERN